MNLRWKIALPFAALFTVLFAVVTVVAITQVSRAVERRLSASAENLAGVLPSQFGANPALLRIIQDGYDAVPVIEENGSFYSEIQIDIAARLKNGALRRESGRLQTIPDYRVAYGRRSETSGLFLLYEPEIVDDEKRAAAMPVLLVAGIGLFLVCVLAYAIAFTIARPVEHLAGLARNVSGGNLDVEVPPGIGSSEIDRLREAFRNMLAGLRQYQENLIKSERLSTLGQMAASIAHEVRNPLSAMKMTVQMLREETAPETCEPYDVLLREIERVELTVSELFSAAHPSRLQKEQVDLGELADEVLTLLQAQLKHLSVAVERTVENATPVDVDPNMFKRAMMNLVLNGAQAMPGGGTLQIDTGRSNGKVRFTVQDEGSGFPASDHEKLFEPFYTTKEGGVGLGLAVTRRIVEDHEGSIGFESSVVGAKFWIELPAAKETHG